MIDATLSIVRGSVLKSGLTIDAQIDPALPDFVHGDPGRLRQVLLNLLNNAVKFTPSGSVTLRVRGEGEGTLPDGRIGERMRFTVADTGIGIAPAQQERLFKRFSQVDGSISRRFGGTELGLAISRHLVTLMGGAIGVESREGVGSTFWFTLVLPRGKAEIDARSDAEVDDVTISPLTPAPSAVFHPRRPRPCACCWSRTCLSTRNSPAPSWSRRATRSTWRATEARVSRLSGPPSARAAATTSC